MSWKPFGKSAASSRRSNVFIQGLDRDIDREHKKLEQLDETTKKLMKDLKKSNYSTNGFAQANLKVMANLKTSAFYSNDEVFALNVDECFQAAKELENASQSVISVTNKTAVEPVKKISTVFPAAQSELKRRKEKADEMEKLQVKAEKIREKDRTGPNIVKLDAAEKSLDQARRDFDIVNEALLRDLVEFDQRRAEYFQPLVESLACAEALFCKESTRACEKALVNMKVRNEQGTVVCASLDASKKSVQEKLNEIKNLSIVSR